MASLPAIANNSDIRFLGTLLGDVIRSYGGPRLFEATETIRKASVERHRGLAEGRTDDHAAVDLSLEKLSLDETLDFVRGFMLFSMLANLAEDRQGIAAEHGADLASAIAQLEAEGIDRTQVRALLDHALIVPVLTAHPTEVRRKSMIDHRNRIATLLTARDAGTDTTPDGDRVDDAILRQIALLWQTRVLRRDRLYVTDEVDTALSYLRDVFLPALPALYQRWDRALGERTPSFLKPGSWIGGDRDGNPYVTADSLKTALARASEAVLGYYCQAVHALGAELSISTEHAVADPAVEALATASGDDATSRADEPYRRALSGIYARLAATQQKLTGKAAPRPGRLTGAPYASPADLRADLVTLAHGLGTALKTGGALGRLIRAVETFGFHLATLDLRQNSAVHERVVAELLKVSGVEPDYLALDEDARVALLRRELANARPLTTRFAAYSDETAGELAILQAAADAHAAYGPACSR
jgi:phosphoenolpyruvate carboxylase